MLMRFTKPGGTISIVVVTGYRFYPSTNVVLASKNVNPFFLQEVLTR
jgi:hypothetical protein